MTLQGGHADAIYSVAWSADGNRIATGSADKVRAPRTAVLFRRRAHPKP